MVAALLSASLLGLTGNPSFLPSLLQDGCPDQVRA
jgi:hypothetical protein